MAQLCLWCLFLADEDPEDVPVDPVARSSAPPLISL